MTGREEHDQKIENNTYKNMVKYPRYVREYYESSTLMGVDASSAKTASTRFEYIRHLEKYLDYLIENHYPISDIRFFRKMKRKDLENYFSGCSTYVTKNGEKKRRSASSMGVIMYAIKKFYDYLVRQEIIEFNPCDYIEKPKLKTENTVVALDQADIQKFKNNICCMARDDMTQRRDYAIFILGIRTGLRVSSIIEINMSDIDWQNKCFKVTEKGGYQRTIRIGEDTARILKDWISVRPKCKTDALFIGTKKKERITVAVIKDNMKKYGRGIDKPISPHKMRSTFATNLYERGGDVYTVMDALGHHNIRNTERYTKVSEERRRHVAETMDDL